ncbi:MAG: hypothetical protein QOE33_463 [Acidobacteriota bacterium]|nr:hypothetical protein [Acidobacteriota bacterium]
MSTNYERSPEQAEAITLLNSGDLELSATCDAIEHSIARSPDHSIAGSLDQSTGPATESAITLAQLSPGARLVLRCRKDWRAASISIITPDCVVLIVASPTGHTYRVRRPHDSLLTFDGAIPILSDRDSSGWRIALARYDARW